MTCSEFQNILPEMIDGEAIGEHAVHLKTCSECSELVSDLRAISSGAKLLCASDEPSPRVWANLQRTLEAEGLIRRPSQMGGVLVPRRSHWRRWAWAGSIAAVLALGASLLLQRHSTVAPQSAVNQTRSIPADTTATTTADSDDEQLLADMSPTTRSEYEQNLKSVNASIQDAQTTLAQDPDNEEARHFLQDAYNQKAMVYELAMDRSMQ
jgi:hypothetical protein